MASVKLFFKLFLLTLVYYGENKSRWTKLPIWVATASTQLVTVASTLLTDTVLVLYVATFRELSFSFLFFFLVSLHMCHSRIDRQWFTVY